MTPETAMNRRDSLAASAVTAATLQAAPGRAPEPKRGPFQHRGYYTIGTRYPTAGLAVWKRVLDAMRADGCNLLIHWFAGGFQSKKYPESWAHNADHENVKADFTRAMIDDAKSKGVRVILGFTPFGYDGVNLMTKARPEWKAVGKGGMPTGEFGIGCWGHSLCPANPACQEFMLGYVREMLFDFYPDAGGLFVESSDYSTCFCDRCKFNGGAGHFEHEYRFVKAISGEAWAKDPDAMVVYPHYFSGDISKHTAGKEKAATEPFDPRYTHFFTPHSTKPNPTLMAKARGSLWWDEAMIFGTPEAVKNGAAHAAAQGFTGYTPTLEAYSFAPTHDEGEPWTVGRRQVPFGIGWVPPDQSAYDELPIRTARIAYRKFARNPALPMEDFRKLLASKSSARPRPTATWRTC